MDRCAKSIRQWNEKMIIISKEHIRFRQMPSRKWIALREWRLLLYRNENWNGMKTGLKAFRFYVISSVVLSPFALLMPAKCNVYLNSACATKIFGIVNKRFSSRPIVWHFAFMFIRWLIHTQHQKWLFIRSRVPRMNAMWFFISSPSSHPQPPAKKYYIVSAPQFIFPVSIQILSLSLLLFRPFFVSLLLSAFCFHKLNNNINVWTNILTSFYEFSVLFFTVISVFNIWWRSSKMRSHKCGPEPKIWKFKRISDAIYHEWP